MTHGWDALDRELRRSRLLCQAEGHDWDIADARAAVARWIGIPEPRPASDALLAAVTNPLPHCICGAGCEH